MIERVERARHGRDDAAEAVETGLPAPLERLESGVLHEWLCGGDGDHDHDGDGGGSGKARSGMWTAPILIFAHFARQALCDQSGRIAVWIGQRLHPQPHALIRRTPQGVDRALLDRSLLVDAAPLEDRLWAIDLCLRSEAAGVVIADVSGMRMAHSRRLQLAAEAGGALALLVKPWWEKREHSAAARRWRIEPVRSPTSSPRWRIELLRSKGVRRFSNGMEAGTSLVVEHDHATHCLRVPADLADRPHPQTDVESIPIRRTG